MLFHGSLILSLRKNLRWHSYFNRLSVIGNVPILTLRVAKKMA